MFKEVFAGALVIALLSGRSFAADVLTTETLWDWRTVADPQISNDGKWIVYVLGWNDRMNDASYSNLWLGWVDGKDQRPLTQGSYRDTSPRWSPDGSRIAFLSNRSSKPQIHVHWTDTSQEAKITDLEEAPSNLEWSPDGKWIAYTARVRSKPAWTIKMPEKPAGAKWAEPAIIIDRLRWRQDGTGLLRPGYVHVFVVPAVGGAARQVTSGDFDHTGSIAWTPDGQWILASSNREPQAEYSLEGGEIWAFPLKEGAPRQLTRRKGPDASPVPSPDGRRIAYTGFNFKHQSYTVTHLYIMDADGSNPKLLTKAHDRDVRSPRWSADSKTIYFLSDDRGASQLFSATLDGGVKQLTNGQRRLGSGYAVADPFSLSRSGRIAITGSSPTGPLDVLTFTVDNPGRIAKVTSVNESLLAGRKLGAVEEINYDSFDGKTIQGWVVKPPDFDASRKYPLILLIHGGPHAMYGVEFAHEFQAMAARGFVILYTNPRGSTGYGEDFGNIIHTRYPGDDYQDLMKGVDVLLAKGYLDPKRLAVTGGSGGGLLTAWIIGHTDRFAAAVSQYPVSNWITQVGTADSGYVHAALWLKAMPWEKPDQYLKHSPIFYAANFRTPTMVLTGEQDLRTPMAESEELYFALKARKVDSVLVRIPDEPHGIRGAHPSHRIAKTEYVLGWIEKYTNQ